MPDFFPTADDSPEISLVMGRPALPVNRNGVVDHLYRQNGINQFAACGVLEVGERTVALGCCGRESNDSFGKTGGA
jgi:hypothetical protein